MLAIQAKNAEDIYTLPAHTVDIPVRQSVEKVGRNYTADKALITLFNQIQLT